MAALAIVEDLEVFEDRIGQLLTACDECNLGKATRAMLEVDS
jgi:hypothetical protein